MGGIFSAFAAWLLSAFMVLANWKMFLGVLLMSIVWIGAYNLVVDLVEEVANFVLATVQSVSGGSGPSAVVGITGIGAWMAGKLFIVQQVGIAVSMIMLKWVLRKIPFLRW